VRLCAPYTPTHAYVATHTLLERGVLAERVGTMYAWVGVRETTTTHPAPAPLFIPHLVGPKNICEEIDTRTLQASTSRLGILTTTSASSRAANRFPT
jgi:hypothetical protein